MLGRLAVGAGLAWTAYAWIPHLLTPLCISQGSTDERRIALTFDDGPDPEWTPRVLALLARRGVHASFFLIGERAARAPQVVTAISAAGHEIGNHSWSHRSLWLSGPRRTALEIDRAQALLADLAGEAPRHFRPPWGMMNAALLPLLHRRGLRCVLWSVQPEGPRPVGAEVQVQRVLARVHPGAIVDLHDAEGTRRAPERLVAALPAMIDRLADAGYRFATVSDLVG